MIAGRQPEKSFFFFEILSDLNQVVPNHLADESQRISWIHHRTILWRTKRYLITSQTRVKRVSRIHHRTILWMVRWCIRLTRWMVRWCIRLTRLTLVCEVIRYRLVQVRQNLKKRSKCLGQVWQRYLFPWMLCIAHRYLSDFLCDFICHWLCKLVLATFLYSLKLSYCQILSPFWVSFSELKIHWHSWAHTHWARPLFFSEIHCRSWNYPMAITRSLSACQRLDTLLLLLFAGTIFCEFLRFGKNRKNKYPQKFLPTHLALWCMYNHKLRDVCHFGTCVLILNSIVSTFLYFFPVPSRACKSDARWWYYSTVGVSRANVNFVLTG